MRAVARHLTQLVGFRPKKLAPRRNVVEEVLDCDLGSLRKCGFPPRLDLPACNFDRSSDARFCLCFQSQPGYRSDRGECFSAKAERFDGKQVVRVVELACSMAEQTRHCIFSDHSLA